MQIGYIGLGKMGFNMSSHLLKTRYNLVAYNRTYKKTEQLVKLGAVATESVESLVKSTNSPRVIWLMVPNNEVTKLVTQLSLILDKDDTVIDGGNTYFKDSIRHSKILNKKGINFLDVGVSGGPNGALNGASLMIGGQKEVFIRYETLFKNLAVKNGYAYVGKSGSGHFVKMVHNAIEYGMMQSVAEGFDLLKQSNFNLDLQTVLKPYQNGSVIESRLIKWLSQAFSKHGTDLANVSGSAQQSGEALWAIKSAKDLNIDFNVIEESLKARLKSQKTPGYQGKIIQALRGEFGGHYVS